LVVVEQVHQEVLLARQGITQYSVQSLQPAVVVVVERAEDSLGLMAVRAAVLILGLHQEQEQPIRVTTVVGIPPYLATLAVAVVAVLAARAKFLLIR
jgi:hypothetical protein